MILWIWNWQSLVSYNFSHFKFLYNVLNLKLVVAGFIYYFASRVSVVKFQMWNLLMLVSHKYQYFWIWNSPLLVSCNISHSLTVWRTQPCNTISPSSQEMPLQKIPNENDPTFEQLILKHEHGLVGTLKHEEIERRGFIDFFFCTTLRKVSSTSSVQCTMSP